MKNTPQEILDKIIYTSKNEKLVRQLIVELLHPIEKNKKEEEK
jgi:hypothetical protein|tara:strand:- start:1308 stop:1436 length:129 start_codon:yes stop_codon:yes gene_type:complete